ncbi:MAG: cysteine desulfurase-like protein [Planctomycetaceae bacterium]|nr:cysteine desulfurase-like protein [Planctomycetaceae bacterium]
MDWPIDTIRQQFPAFGRTQNGTRVALFDGPAGSQVPYSVIEAVSHYLGHTNCNRGASFATSLESDAILDAAHVTLATFLGAPDPESVIFGPNMTSITLQVSRAVSTQWKPGDEIIVTRLDHDANVSPWVLAAQDRGVTVHHIDLNPEDWTLNMEDYHSKLSERTVLVAVGYASNATGTINPVRSMIEAARRVNALTYVDAVHFAPHGRINVTELGCDFLVCSAYKFFGPHVGILWGRPELLESIRPCKLRPSPESLPGKWMTGTQNHEGIAGAAAAVRYLASLGNQPAASLSDQITASMSQICQYEQFLSQKLLAGLAQNSKVRVLGITDPCRIAERVPTVSFLVKGRSPRQCAEQLAGEGFYVWSGNHYALPFTEAAGLEPDGTIRVGALHYTTTQEVDGLLAAIERL